MKQLKILISLLLFVFNCSAKVIIEGQLVHLKYKGNLYYHEPIDGFCNHVYNPKIILFKNDSLFRIEASIKKSGFLYIELPGKLLKIFITPNDSLSLIVTYTPEKQANNYIIESIQFGGSNAAGQNIFSNNPYYLNQQNFLLENSFAKVYSTINEFLDASLTDIKKLLWPFDSLYEHGKISTGFYNAVSEDIKSSHMFQVINLFGYIHTLKNRKLVNNDKYQVIAKDRDLNYDLYTKNNFDSLRVFIYRLIDPLDKSICYTCIGTGLTEYYFHDVEKGLVKSNLTYDSVFLSLKPSRRYLGYIKGKLLESMWANSIYWDAATESDKSELSKNLKLFKEYFPNSLLLPFLKRRINNALKDDEVNTKPLSELNFITKRAYTNLKDIAIENFKGQYVFVDIWATWCTPCIQELLYKNQLKKFLDKKDIKLLYVSIDETISKEKWTSYIKAKKLFGSHFLASEIFKENIKKELFANKEITIPRYLLLNDSGNIVGFDLPRPSDMKSLSEAINKLIKR